MRLSELKSADLAVRSRPTCSVISFRIPDRDIDRLTALAKTKNVPPRTLGRYLLSAALTELEMQLQGQSHDDEKVA